MKETVCIIGQKKSPSTIALLEEARRAFGSFFFVPIDGITVGTAKGFSLTYRATDLLRFKAIIPRIPEGRYSYAYQLLSLFPPETYMAIRPISFLIAEERFFLLSVLRKRGVPTVEVKLARSAETAGRMVDHFPVILRTDDQKTGVVVRSALEAKTTIDALVSLKKPVMAEEVIDGMVSLYVGEPRVLAVVRKRAEGDVVFAAGMLKKEKVDRQVEQLALDTARALEAQVARVDITTGREPRVVNVELNPELMIPGKVAGVNLPAVLMEIVAENYRSFRERPMMMKFFEDAKVVGKAAPA